MFTRKNRRRNTAVSSTPTAAAESLETRSLLSATATLANGTLTITGTEGGDRVVVDQYGNDQVRVVLGGGRTAGPFRTAAINSIVANMGGGNDSLAILPTQTQVGEIRVNMGRGGNDFLQINTNYVGSLGIDGRQTQLDAAVFGAVGTLRANFGGGSDKLKLLNASVDRIFAEMGGGNDELSLSSVSDVRGGSVQMGSGDDAVKIASNSRIRADLFGGSGRDYFSAYRKDNAGVRLNSFEDPRWI
jgi:hypothetical protein